MDRGVGLQRFLLGRSLIPGRYQLQEHPAKQLVPVGCIDTPEESLRNEALIGFLPNDPRMLVSVQKAASTSWEVSFEVLQHEFGLGEPAGGNVSIWFVQTPETVARLYALFLFETDSIPLSRIETVWMAGEQCLYQIVSRQFQDAEYEDGSLGLRSIRIDCNDIRKATQKSVSYIISGEGTGQTCFSSMRNGYMSVLLRTRITFFHTQREFPGTPQSRFWSDSLDPRHFVGTSDLEARLPCPRVFEIDLYIEDLLARQSLCDNVAPKHFTLFYDKVSAPDLLAQARGKPLDVTKGTIVAVGAMHGTSMLLATLYIDPETMTVVTLQGKKWDMSHFRFDQHPRKAIRRMMERDLGISTNPHHCATTCGTDFVTFLETYDTEAVVSLKAIRGEFWDLCGWSVS